MRTPSPTSKSSRSVAAAALLQLSQTPPRSEAASRAGTSALRNIKQQSTGGRSPTTEFSRHNDQGDVIMEMPRTLKSNVHIFSSPLSDSDGDVKASNSDDEDMDGQVCDVYRGNSTEVPQAPFAVPHVVTRLPQAPLTKHSTIAAEPTFAPGLALIERSNTAPSRRSPYTPVEDLRGISVVEPALALWSNGSSQLSALPPQTAYPILTVGSDELELYLRRTASLSQQGYGAPLKHASTPLRLPEQPPQQTGPRPLRFNKPMMGQRHVSQPCPQAQHVMPPTIDPIAPQHAQQPLSSAEEPSAPPSPYGMLVPGRASSEGAEVRKKLQIPCAPPRALLSKRIRVPLSTMTATAARDGFRPKQVDIRDFKYRTIKAINMPAQTDVIPGQQPPEPTPDSYPYGEDIDYRASMLIWWCDDLEFAYSETVRRYRLKFPDERTITEDTVRKRYMLFLEKLARKYGLKPEDELEEPGGRVAIRGKQLGHKYNTINGVHVYSAAAGHDVAGTVRRRRAGNEPTQHRGFLKACICVWRDTSNVSFEEIKQRLQKDYGWNIGENTVKKLYYSERARVYDTYNGSGTIDQEACIKKADEDLEQLQLHFQQRRAYLLKTFGQRISGKDTAYMLRLEQLIASKEQDQLQRARQMGSGPVRMVEEAVEDVHDDAGEATEIKEGDVMMQDVDPGIAGNQDVD